MGSTTTCAFCREDLITAYGGFDVPPLCINLMENSDSIDIDNIAGKVRVDLCEEDTEITRRMVEDYGTSPLPECDVDHVSYQDKATAAALAGQTPADADDDGVTQRMLDDALMTVRADQTGDTDHIADHKLVEAKVIILSLADLGVIDGDVVRELKDD